MGKDTFYFSHDYNVRSDEKIKALIRKHNLLGYGIFWAIVEDLYNNANALRMDYEGIAYEYRVDVSLIESILKDFDLFVFDNDNFGSLSVQRRLDERCKKSSSARESANKRWEKIRTQCERIEIKCEGNAIKERKGKEIKEKKEITEKPKKVFIPPSIEEVKEYFKENGYSEISAIKAFNFYSCADWIDSCGKKVTSWKQKMQGVWFKEEDKITEKNKDKFNSNEYNIPNDALFGMTETELKEACLNGKYPKL